MNGIVFIALIALGCCVIAFALKVIEGSAQNISHRLGIRNMAKWAATQERLNKRGEYNVNKEWRASDKMDSCAFYKLQHGLQTDAESDM